MLIFSSSCTVTSLWSQSEEFPPRHTNSSFELILTSWTGELLPVLSIWGLGFSCVEGEVRLLLSAPCNSVSAAGARLRQPCVHYHQCCQRLEGLVPALIFNILLMPVSFQILWVPVYRWPFGLCPESTLNAFAVELRLWRHFCLPAKCTSCIKSCCAPTGCWKPNHRYHRCHHFVVI